MSLPSFPLAPARLHYCFLLALIAAAALTACPPNAAADDAAGGPSSSNLLGGNGFRSGLEEAGIAFSLEYTHEYLANISGGIRCGGEYNGLIVSGIEVDLEKVAGWAGGLMHADVFYTLGNSLSERSVGDESNVSNINFRNSVRLAELWIESPFLIDHLSLRAGQLGFDSDFGASAISDDLPGGDLFLNSDFGALPILSFNVPVPIYAIYAPGAMARFEPGENFYLRAAVYDGNPAPGEFGDPSPGSVIGAMPNDHGVRWRLSGDEGALWSAEIGYRVSPSTGPGDGVATVGHLSAHGERRVHGGTAQLGADQTQVGQEGLPGIYKLGAFFHTDEFTDFRSGQGLEGNYGFYAVASQMVWRETGNQGLTLFTRAGFAPEDRNVLDCTLDCGAVCKGLFPGRDDDNIGVAFTYKGYSDDFSASEQAAGGAPRGHESIIELTYEFLATDWLPVQPDVQYVINPAGDPFARDAWVIGVRSTVVF